MDEPDNVDTSHGAEEKPARTETGVGALLRAARLANGLTIEDVARQLRLSVRQITALEEDDYDKLVGGTFLRGFVRNYAKLLQLDEAPLLQQLEVSLPPPPPQTISNPIEGIPFPTERKYGSRSLIVAVGLVLAVLLLVYEIYRGNEGNIGKQSSVNSETRTEVEQATVPLQSESQDDAILANEGGIPPPAGEATIAEQESTALSSAPAPAPSPAQQGSPAAVVPKSAEVPTGLASQSANSAGSAVVPPPPAVSGPNVMRLIFEGESWAEVKDSRGKLLLSRINPRGTEQVLQGTPPYSLTIGNAAQVRLVYNNKPVDLAPYINAYGGTARLSLE